MKKIFAVALVFLIISCRKKADLPGWDIDVLIPVASTTLKINDLVKDSVLQINSDQSLSLVYSGEVYKVDFDTLFMIPDTSVYQTFKCVFCNTGIEFPANFSMFNQTQNTKYSLGDVELVEALIRSGSIEVELRSTFPKRTLLTYELPYAKDIYGNNLFVTDTLPGATPGNPAVIIKSYDLKGYRIDLRGINGNSYNTLVSRFQAITLEAATVTNSDSVRVLNTFRNVVPEYAKGYFGQTLVEIAPENEAVQKLHNILGGSVDFKDFDLRLKIRNGVGVDIQLLPKQIISSNISSGANAVLTGSVPGSTVNINRASINSSLSYPPIEFSEYFIKMNQNNSNADELFEIFPDSIAAAAEIALNPLGNISNNNDFIYYGNGINISLDAEIPFNLVANKLVFADTLEMNFAASEGSEDDPVKRILGGNLILDVYNSYPFDAKPQLFLMDENFAITDSLIQDNSTIASADLNSDYYSSGKKLSKILIPVNPEKIEKLEAAKNLMIKLIFTTSVQANAVKIYSEYEVDIKLVADINYLIENN